MAALAGDREARLDVGEGLVVPGLVWWVGGGVEGVGGGLWGERAEGDKSRLGQRQVHLLYMCASSTTTTREPMSRPRASLHKDPFNIPHFISDSLRGVPVALLCAVTISLRSPWIAARSSTASSASRSE